MAGRNLWANSCLTREPGLECPLKKGKKDLRINVRTSHESYKTSDSKTTVYECEFINGIKLNCLFKLWF